jgi:signal peptidase I
MTSRSKWLIVGIAAALPVILFFVLVRFYRIPAESMENTIMKGDYIGVLSVGFSKPTRGDIIVFPYPPNPAEIFVKRVVGISGDHIRIVEKKLYVNGTAVEEAYAVYKRRPNDPQPDFPREIPDFDPRGTQILKSSIVNGEVVVPPNSYFVLGDNRDNSLDSRHWGFVPTDSVRGRPLFIYWSAGEDDAGIRWNRIFSGVH